MYVVEPLAGIESVRDAQIELEKLKM